MICVTLGRGRHRTLIEEWKAAAAAGAKLVELRVDCLRSELNLSRLLDQRITPIVLTVRRGADGGLWRGDEEKRQRILREAIVAGVDYVDLELDVAKSIPRFGKTKRIISYHNLKKTPDDLDDLVQQSIDLGADIVKVATLANSVSDASRVLEMIRNSSVPTIGIAMGPLGVFTRILGRKFGAPFTFAGFNPERTFAPGMPLMSELEKDYRYESIDRDSEVYAVIGDPIGHSLSPAVHNNAFRHLGLNKVYVPINIPRGTVKESLEKLAWLGIKGLSVTIPHKETILGYLTRSDGAVEMTGSCNTVIYEGDQRVGHNTDYRAVMAVLEDALGGETAPGVSPLMDKQVLILGAGGVSRTIAFGLVRRGAAVTITNHNDDRAVSLAEEVGCRHVSWSQRAGLPVDLLINGTPVGMHPNVNDSPVPPAAFRPGMLVFDTVYHPENTLFLKLARERECQTVSGVDMFVRQAALQFKLFTGQEPPLDVMYETVRRKFSVVGE